MSTRGLIGFVHKGEVKCYLSEHSSQLSNLGSDIVELSELIDDWDSFTELYEKIAWGDKEITSCEESLNARTLIPAIHNEEIEMLVDSSSFAEDTLFCEYAYLLNLDRRELEIYSSNYQTKHDQNDKHLPLNLLATYPLHEIPNHWKEFIEARSTEVEHDWSDFYRNQGIEPNDLEL